MNEIDSYEIKTILFNISKKIILPNYKNLKNTDIKFKDNKDIVTKIDLEVENELKKILHSLLPDSLFVGEETFFKNPKIINAYLQEKFCWTVDPIDGTRNFVKGNDKFAIMIALSFGKKILQSWIYKPLSGEFYFAILDNGAFNESLKIYNSKRNDISNSVGSISLKYWDSDYMKKMQEIKHRFKEVNSYGCIGLEYIDIAKGYRDFTILSKLSPWDHIPGILIVKESGGSILHFDKLQYNHTKLKNNLVVANSEKLQDEIINLIME